VADMATKAKGKWAQGIQPRNFCWIMTDKLAICERPGGYGGNHRRVRRQEEIIWIREQGFASVISLIPAPHNLHNYDELGVRYLHRPFSQGDDPYIALGSLFPEIHRLIAGGGKIVIHGEEVGDKPVGLMGGYIRWTGMVTDGPQCTTLIERIAGRQLDPYGRSLIEVGANLRSRAMSA
jgi:hypothetical protein